MVIPYLLLLAAIGIERLVELAISRRNAAHAAARGGVEHGHGHFRWMVLVHGAFLPACALEVLLLDRPFVAALGVPMLGLALAAQGLRYWAISALGPAWNVRVVVVPGAPVVRRGPYRWLRHPNYLAVALEGVAIPLVHTAWITAVAFTAANAALLRVRIRCEETALEEHGADAAALGELPRLLPLPPRRGRRAARGGEG